jgi:ABC-type amino acid transport system permease subunit
MRVLVFSTNLSETEECSEILLQMYTSFHRKYPLLLQILIKLEFFRPIFEKYSNIKFNEKLSSGSRDVPRGRTDERRDRQT